MSLIRFVLALAAVTACVQRVKEAVEPTPSGTGSMTCRQIVEECDKECGDPLCLRRCSDQGTAEGAAQHTAVLDCAQQNGCMDEDCIRANCKTEADTCQGPEPMQQEPAAIDAGAAPGDVAPGVDGGAAPSP